MGCRRTAVSASVDDVFVPLNCKPIGVALEIFGCNQLSGIPNQRLCSMWSIAL